MLLQHRPQPHADEDEAGEEEDGIEHVEAEPEAGDAAAPAVVARARKRLGVVVVVAAALLPHRGFVLFFDSTF